MKRIYLLLMCCMMAVLVSAQTQVKTMYNAQKKEVTKEKKAKFYRIVEQRADKIYKVSYYEVNGPMLWDGLFTSIDPYRPIQRNTYFPSGKLKKSETYENGNHGVSEYYENGQMMNKYTRNADNQFTGEVLSFYEDGTVLRRDSYDAGKLIDGHCYDRAGKEVAHYDFFVDASFNGTEYGVSKAFRNLIYQNLNYPRSAMNYAVQGVIYVGFTVMTNGKMDNIEVVNAVYSDPEVKEEIVRDMEAEAIRLVQFVNGWSKPAKMNGQPVDADYVASIIFQLK